MHVEKRDEIALLECAAVDVGHHAGPHAAAHHPVHAQGEDEPAATHGPGGIEPLLGGQTLRHRRPAGVRARCGRARFEAEDRPGASGDRADEVYVEFSDGNRVAAEIVGSDLNADVALLKVDPDGLSLTPLSIGRSDSITVGEPVAAIGSPFGERQSLTIGVVSAIDRNIQSLTRFSIGDAIQTDAAINPGNSGGPLLDAGGRVIGINAQIKSQSGGGEGVGFAIPADTVRRSLRELRDDGRVSYGFLGVTSVTVWPQLAERLDLDDDDGALIQKVEEGSPAAKAGLRAGDDEIAFQGNDVIAGGDVIVAVDGRELTREHDLTDLIGAHDSGDRVQLEYLRDGQRKAVTIKLASRPAGASP